MEIDAPDDRSFYTHRQAEALPEASPSETEDLRARLDELISIGKQILSRLAEL